MHVVFPLLNDSKIEGDESLKKTVVSSLFTSIMPAKNSNKEIKKQINYNDNNANDYYFAKYIVKI